MLPSSKTPTPVTTTTTPSEGDMIECPVCGVPIEVVLHPSPYKPNRLVAYHACKGMDERAVYETDVPGSVPPPEAAAV